MKRGPDWSLGILITMLGIVLVLFGIMKATILPSKGILNWSLSIVGVMCCIGGVLVARGDRTSGRRPTEHRDGELPRAWMHRDRLP